jgi:hypothetical protein
MSIEQAAINLVEKGALELTAGGLMLGGLQSMRLRNAPM